MHNVTKFKKTLLLLTLLVFGSQFLNAQTSDALGTYTPYSLFGLGEIEKGGTSINRGLGGIGTGLRDKRYINYMNPASITERDTLSFMFDFGMNQKNFYNSDGDASSAYNSFNMNNIVITAPIYKKSALILGISPYSNIGYEFESIETDPYLVANYGDIRYQQYGEGSINKFFIGAAMNLFKNFSLGAEFIYYFGALNRNSEILLTTQSNARAITSGWDYSLGASSATIGLQYFTDIKDRYHLTLGATYGLSTTLQGHQTDFVYASSSTIVDTIAHNELDDAEIIIPEKISLGFTFSEKDRWLLGFDYTRQDWSKTKFSDVAGSGTYTPSVSSEFKLGFEFIPNKYDVRYYLKRATYRVGAYYDKTYISVGDKQINAGGFTLGMALPISKWNNAINWSVDFGQRGTLQDSNVRERYIQFTFNISIHDIWFRKHRYD